MLGSIQTMGQILEKKEELSNELAVLDRDELEEIDSLEELNKRQVG